MLVLTLPVDSPNVQLFVKKWVWWSCWQVRTPPPGSPLLDKLHYYTSLSPLPSLLTWRLLLCTPACYLPSCLVVPSNADLCSKFVFLCWSGVIAYECAGSFWNGGCDIYTSISPMGGGGHFNLETAQVSPTQRRMKRPAGAVAEQSLLLPLPSEMLDFDFFALFSFLCQ